MIRKTRVMSEAGVMLVRIETFDGDSAPDTRFRVGAAAMGEDFADPGAAIDAFWTAVGATGEPRRLNAA